MHEDAETAWFVANGPPGNHLLRADFNVEGTGAGPRRRTRALADEKIDRLLETIGGLTGGIRWLVFPWDRPSDLADRLANRGLVPGEGNVWMFRSLSGIRVERSTRSAGIEQVGDRPALRAWWAASAQGFGASQRATQPWYDAYRRRLDRDDSYALQFVGVAGGRTTSSATLILAEGIAGIYDVSTVPRFRGRGFGTAMVNHLLAAAGRRGYSHAGLQTSGHSDFYARLGFERGFQEREYIWSAD